jgi:hypothetical protein
MDLSQITFLEKGIGELVSTMLWWLMSFDEGYLIREKLWRMTPMISFYAVKIWLWMEIPYCTEQCMTHLAGDEASRVVKESQCMHSTT